MSEASHDPGTVPEQPSDVSREAKLQELILKWEQEKSQGRADRASFLAGCPADLVDDLRSYLANDREIEIAFAAVRPPGSSPGGADLPGGTSDATTLPASIGKYRVIARLGQGGMGAVYKVKQPGRAGFVALKVCLPRVSVGTEHFSRFKDEAHKASQLHHPHIVTIHDVDEDRSEDLGVRPFFTMEHMGGGSLADRLRDPLPPAEAARLLLTISRAVHHAHQAGIIHRDLKPANVLFDEAGRPKITDFGLAKQLAADPEKTGPALQTQPGMILGTPAYMAPEQARGQNDLVAPVTDVYGLGVILYECLTGQPPFRGSTVPETLRLVLDQDPIPPRRFQPRLPKALETVCLHCLHKDPARRYPSAEALGDDLQRFLEDKPILVRPIGLGERLSKWARRHPAAAALAATVVTVFLGLILGGFAFAAYESRRAEQAFHLRQQAEDAREEAQGRLALQELERGLPLCLEGDAGHGMLLLASGLNHAAAAGNHPLEQSLRTLLAGWNPYLHRLKAVLPHRGPVTAAAFSPDGKWLLTGSEDRVARLWDWQRPTLHPVLELPHDGAVLAAAFSPDGRTLLTGSADRNARLWDAATGRLLGDPLEHPAEVLAVTFNPGAAAALTGCADKQARLWDVRTRRQIGNNLAHDGKVTAAAFSPNGALALTGGQDGLVRFWDARTGTPDGNLLSHGSPLQALALSKDGRTLTSASSLRCALWDTASRRPHGPELLHTTPVVATAFGTDGAAVVTASSNRLLRQWDVVHGGNATEAFRHPEEVRVVALGPDNRTFLTGDEDGVARVWEGARGVQPVLTQSVAMRVQAAHSSPDGKLLALIDNRTAWLWDIEEGRLLGNPLRHDGDIVCVTFHPAAQLVLTGGQDRTARLWRTETREALGEPWQHGGLVRSVSFAPDGKTAYTASGNAVSRWGLDSGKLVSDPWVLPEGVRAIVLSPDGQILGTTGDDDRVRLYDPQGNRIGQPLLHDAEITSVRFAPDGRTLLTGCFDRTSRLWDSLTGKPIGRPLRTSQAVTTAAWSPDGKVAATAGMDGSVQCWEPRSGRPFGRPLRHHRGAPVRATVFHSRGNLLLTAGEDRTSRLWDVNTGHPLGRPMFSGAAVATAAFGRHKGKEVVLAASFNRTITLWPVPVPLRGASERLQLWVQVRTGMELDKNEEARLLDPRTWHNRRQLLGEMGSDTP